MSDLATSIALVFVIEGILYSLFPEGMKRVVTQVTVLPVSALRLSGLIVAAVGVVAVWLIRG
jgi:uncharacterized protein